MNGVTKNIAIIGCGNIGGSIANGLVASGEIKPDSVYLTKRNGKSLDKFSERGFKTTSDNVEAVKNAGIIIIAVTPQQLDEILFQIKENLDPLKHIVMSVVSGATIDQMRSKIGNDTPVIRVMPNTAIAIQESMTCISANPENKNELKLAVEIFDKLGKTVVIHEDLMVPATALCACGIAFFMRAIRAASQGGIEIGFHAEDALFMAAQTAKGAAAMIIEGGNHPEREVDKVTTPQGCTIAGLNQMEHSGFSSSLIKGIVTSAQKADTLYSK
ncbi:MAG: pyrroline-5-carboxylate reductase [Melioribacteraceae bacterium]|nr:pyrroline-5-carboxylate reductase [Melioribacteraceae bacterium]MCF8264901.1 pyrroline-5-carboxylate reductase [Melioribacteraceae bacterium]MCF8414129.1 pyrroline-5-carboxylate reductase [Melioribacteraceae bacterium]MCF8432168.1 pyrroline-5-carboxylate reductase [Melioribacteraceae bacterium]